MAEGFELGDVVRLKSGGGPDMTVSEIAKNDDSFGGLFEKGDLFCIWYNTKKNFHEEQWFHPYVVTKAIIKET
jgi:uncharacterized protein YodC (DUF2158 family)